MTSDPLKTYTTSYEYNGGSQLLKMIYPSGQQVSVNHDDKGRTQSLTYNPGDSSGYLTGMGYNIAGQVTGLTFWQRGRGELRLRPESIAVDLADRNQRRGLVDKSDLQLSSIRRPDGIRQHRGRGQCRPVDGDQQQQHDQWDT